MAEMCVMRIICALNPKQFLLRGLERLSKKESKEYCGGYEAGLGFRGSEG